MSPPAPLLELPPSSVPTGTLHRRWFTSPQMDLVVWEDASGDIAAFQLCYDKPLAERSLTWRRGSGFSHQAVDAGDPDGPGHKGTPLLTTSAPADPARLRHELAGAGQQLPAHLLRFVEAQLQRYPDAT